MRIKDGVRMNGEMAMALAAMVVQEVCREGGFDCVVTSGKEKRRPNSLHFHGWALDFRANHIDAEKRLWFAANVRQRLGDGDAYDVILHGNGPAMHLHVEYDPKD